MPEDRFLAAHARSWLSNLACAGNHTKNRIYKLFGMNSSGLNTFLPRYLTAQRPPKGFESRRACVHLTSIIPFMHDSQVFYRIQYCHCIHPSIHPFDQSINCTFFHPYIHSLVRTYQALQSYYYYLAALNKQHCVYRIALSILIRSHLVAQFGARLSYCLFTYLFIRSCI